MFVSAIFALAVQAAAPAAPLPRRGDIVSAPPAPAVVPLTDDQVLQLKEIGERINAAAPPPIAEIEAKLLETERDVSQAAKQCVPSGIVLEPLRAATLVPLVVAGVHKGLLRNGWSARFEKEGCEGASKVNYLVMQTAQGALALMRMGNGETLANASVLMDAHRMVGPLMLIEFERRGVKCDASNFLLGEIKVTERGDDLGEEIFGARLKGSWTETWEFTGCGMRGSVPIEFRWDGAGGAYINGRMKEAVIEKL